MANKFTVFSDAHIGIYNNFAKLLEDDNINDRSQASIDSVGEAFDIAIKEKTHLVSVGDLFDNRGSLDVRLINRVADLFAKKVPQLAKGCNVYLLAGNHDQIDNSDLPENALTWLRYFSTDAHRIYVLNQVQSFQFNDVCISFLPYSENVKASKAALKELISTLPKDKPNILFAHVGVEGAVDGGMYTHRLGGAYGLGDLYPKVFEKILLGHYHRRQALGEADNIIPEQAKALYVGSTSQKSFSDEGQQKGVDLLKIKDKTVQDKFIPLVSKEFLTIDLADSQYKNITNEKLSELFNTYYVRVVSHEAKQAKQLQDVINHENIKVAVALKEEQKSENRLGIKVTDSEEKIVTEYAKKYYPTSTDTAIRVLKKAEGIID